MAERKRYQVFIPERTAAWLQERAIRALEGQSVPVRAAAELALWRLHLDAELRATPWTLGELACLAQIMGGSLPDDTAGKRVYVETLDTLSQAPDFAEQHGVDPGGLVAKVQALGPTANHTLMDAIARWWATESEHTADAWRAVGVRVYEPEDKRP